MRRQTIIQPQLKYCKIILVIKLQFMGDFVLCHTENTVKSWIQMLKSKVHPITDHKSPEVE